MDPGELVAIHYNARLAHQVRQAMAFAGGFQRHGQRYVMTPDIELEADVHICLGPNYAWSRWRNHPRTVLLDRAFWGDERGFVTLGWAKSDGGRVYPVNCPPDRWQQQGQKLHPLRDRDGPMILLADYGMGREALDRAVRSFGADAWRAHPHGEHCALSVPRVDGDLDAALEGFNVAAGWMTSALIHAGLRGLHVRALDERSLAARWRRDSRQSWCHDLAYANWHESEIASGDAWGWLSNVAHVVDRSRSAAGYDSRGPCAARH